MSTAVGVLGVLLFLGGGGVTLWGVLRMTRSYTPPGGKTQRWMLRSVGVWQIGVALILIHVGGAIVDVIGLIGVGLMMILFFPLVFGDVADKRQ